MIKKSSFHYTIALAMFIMFLAQVMVWDRANQIRATITTILLLGLAITHVVVGIRKRTG